MSNLIHVARDVSADRWPEIAYSAGLRKTLTTPAWWATLALGSLGLFIASTRWGRSKWPSGQGLFMGSLSAGIGLGLLVPLLLPARTVAASGAVPPQATAPSQPRSRSALNKTFEPAQGVESASVFIGQ